MFRTTARWPSILVMLAVIGLHGCGGAGRQVGAVVPPAAGPVAGGDTHGNYARLPGTVAQSQVVENTSNPNALPSLSTAPAPELIDGDIATNAHTHRDIYIRMEEPHPLSHIVIRRSNFQALRVYVGPMGRTRQGDWTLVHSTKTRLPEPIVLDVVAVTDRVRIQVLSTARSGNAAGVDSTSGGRVAAEVELYGANVSRDVLTGRFLAPPPPRVYEEDTGPKRPMEYIGEAIARTSPSGMADIIILASQSPDDDRHAVDAIKRDILKLTKPLIRQGIDVRFTPVNPTGAQWTTDAHRVTEMLLPGSQLPPLTALIHALRLTSARGADLHCVYVTNGPVTVANDSEAALAELMWRVWDDAVSLGVRVHVFGLDERFQRQLARRTGGVFQEFGNAAAEESETDALLVALDPNALAAPFEAIVEDAATWLAADGADGSGAANVVLFVDYSRSMQGRLRAVSEGMRVFDRALRAADLRPTYTVVRFAETVGTTASGVSGTTVSHSLTDVEDIPLLFRYPALGDERLIDAVVEALPTAADPSMRNVAIIVTDEPPSSRRAS
ncbi:MAG: hypothetical protein ABGY41_08195, partial [Candidatus Poribacteria bacterium]